jgi:hypothetical protein
LTFLIFQEAGSFLEGENIQVVKILLQPFWQFARLRQVGFYESLIPLGRVEMILHKLFVYQRTGALAELFQVVGIRPGFRRSN